MWWSLGVVESRGSSGWDTGHGGVRGGWVYWVVWWGQGMMGTGGSGVKEWSRAGGGLGVVGV